MPTKALLSSDIRAAPALITDHTKEVALISHHIRAIKNIPSRRLIPHIVFNN
jgi:hypothetical protein